MATISLELLAQVHQYLGKKSTLRDLESWVLSRMPILLGNPDNEAGRLVSFILLNVAELRAGIRTERTIRQRLSRRVSLTVVVPIETHPAVSITGTSTVAASMPPNATPSWWVATPLPV